jgi:glycosyltransferase involved in cell wall biosynthesis
MNQLIAIKICIWMNIPSHYQSAFFGALGVQKGVDLKVVYLNGVSNDRTAEGWLDTHNYQSFECNAEGSDLVENLDQLIPDWKERIHLIGAHFAPALIDYFCRREVAWCHWSEMSGIRLAEILGYRMSIYRLLNPLMILCKWNEGRCIRKHALGAFGQGRLARRTFRLMGVSNEKIADLYYVPAPLRPMVPCARVVEFAAGRKVFLSVGALCKRKGIDILLKAFARLENKNWCLVLCGLDKVEGRYQALSEKLGIEDCVLFLGAYPSERIAEVYAAADVFILSSRFDGWGAVLNEAASLGMPLITTDMCGAAWHVLEEGKNGFRVKVESVGDLAKKMRVYMEHPQLVGEHGCYSKDLFFREFTPERNAERLIQGISSFTRGRSLK